MRNPRGGGGIPVSTNRLAPRPSQPQRCAGPAFLEAGVDAGRVSDLDDLLAEWEAEDEADRRARPQQTIRGAIIARLGPGRISPTRGSMSGASTLAGAGAWGPAIGCYDDDDLPGLPSQRQEVGDG